jgi:hypothetical protein
MELEVRYEPGVVLIELITYSKAYERSARVIARSEELLSNMHLKDIQSTAQYEDLKAYFKRKGWEVVGEL